jgi:hypothetical protein
MAGDLSPAASQLTLGFPSPGARIQEAYANLYEAQDGRDDQKEKLGHLSDVPRPWDPATCLDPELRWQLWVWLDDVAEWINSEYVWEGSGDRCIPDCWPLHPHLVHELAVVADQRRRAGQASKSDFLENWHRIVLPSFFDRMKQRLKQSCDDYHQSWPARGRYTRYTGEAASELRLRAFKSDLAALSQKEDVGPPGANSRSAQANTGRPPTPTATTPGQGRS